ncbi:MAG: hypothetical protein WD512_00495, partial [Candidatus Paceibacterota bacterium]
NLTSVGDNFLRYNKTLAEITAPTDLFGGRFTIKKLVVPTVKAAPSQDVDQKIESMIQNGEITRICKL